MSDAPVEKGVGVIRLKLGASLTGPTKRMAADLEEAAIFCNVARNAAARAWQRWREDHSEWSPDPIVKRDGTPWLMKGRHPKPQNFPLPKTVVIAEAEKELSGSMLLYYATKKFAPSLGSKIRSVCSQEVWDYLRTKIPHGHAGVASYQWEAVLLAEASLATFRSMTIPVPAQDLDFAYADVGPKSLQKLAAGGQAVIRTPLWSKESGREKRSLVCRLCVGGLPDGQRALLSRILRGEWELCDSELVYRPSGKSRGWYFNIVYKQPRRNLGLDKERVAVLESTGGEATHPFVAHHGDANWTLGHVGLLLNQLRRLEDRRRWLRSPDRAGGRGHGVGHFFAHPREITRGVRTLLDSFTKELAAEVVKFCKRHNCGTVDYHEPAVACRGKSWFAAKKVYFDWTRFHSQLKHQCWLNGIDLITLGDARESKGDARKPKDRSRAGKSAGKTTCGRSTKRKRCAAP